MILKKILSALILKYKSNKLLETFLRDFGPCWHDDITQLLWICQLHDAYFPFHQVLLYWIVVVILVPAEAKKQVWNDLDLDFPLMLRPT